MHGAELASWGGGRQEGTWFYSSSGYLGNVNTLIWSFIRLLVQISILPTHGLIQVANALVTFLLLRQMVEKNSLKEQRITSFTVSEVLVHGWLALLFLG